MRHPVYDLLKYYRFNLNNEKALQLEVEIILRQNQECRKYQFQREFYLSKRHIIDFLVDGSLGIEIKINGSKKNIYRQLDSYTKYDKVKYIILLTNKIMNLPAVINDKPTYIINLGTAWL